MKCPKCFATMESVAFHGVEVHRCTDCHGLWFDEFDKDALAAIKGSEAIDDGDRAVGRVFNEVDRILCPCCDAPMIRMVDVRPRHVTFEHCTICGGSFLDAGEFHDLKAHSLLDYFRELGVIRSRPRGA